ncbi:putative hsp33 redox-regulated chaperone [Mesoplasma florum L1]|uniref:Hsp33 redox-regulated chaperone n=1 Tax=Mesoplasma florum (strain ATCC 33453 / NBRC 100688 / NCTC 11704 / L1) TaxID=265311 RepID=Q6F299_MESFL|nr:Hsp33 family molecular chaperone HslO [Mesoplasma florum]AAT75374.1 putative hsp33 redox-regulated chaperone [Mesoplasma florum L1]AVN64771.1 molecular chaperone Hsp33 [Mesoplasma florum]
MDLQVRAISHKHNAKIAIVDISESMREICDLQKTNPFISIALSKFTLGNTLISLDNKELAKINSNYVSKNGAVKKMIAEFQNNKVRAYAQVKDFDIEEYIPRLSNNPVYATVGTEGQLLNSRDMGLKEPYISTINTDSPNMDHIWMDFLRDSNQVGSLLTSEVKLDDELKIKKVVGILIQLLPEHTQEDIDLLDSKLGNTKFICEVLMKSTNYNQVIKEIFEDAVILESKQIIFECTCNDNKILDSVKLLGQNEIQQLIENKEDVQVICDFCNKEYIVNNQNLKNLI